MHPRQFRFNVTTMARLGLVLIVLFLLWSLSPFRNSGPSDPEITYSQLLAYMQSDMVRDATYNPVSGRLSLSLGWPDTESEEPSAPEGEAVSSIEDDEAPVMEGESAVLPDIDETVSPAPAITEEGGEGEIESEIEDGSQGEVASEEAPLSPAINASWVERGQTVATVLPPGDTETIRELAKQSKVKIVERARPSRWPAVMMAFLPIMLLIAFFWWMARRQSGAQGNPALGFGKSRVKALNPEDNSIRFDDVAGCEEAKAEVREVVEFLRDPEKYVRVSANMPHGLLMAGPPGTGKTLLAKAIAGEANVPFFFTSGSDFVEMFVGVGAARVRDMFAQAKAQAPSIIFIDELDAIGGKRNNSGPGSGGNDEREQTLNQILIEMQGFAGREGVIVLAATNRPDMLDPALTRPGRFDREIMVGLPDRAGRLEILKVHAQKVPIDVSVDWDSIAAGTPGFSGAELANLINEAALAAAREDKRLVSQNHLEWARDRVMMGAEKHGGMKNERERKITAYHEAGHAIVARFLENSDPVHKITIVPRGKSLGLMMQLPREDSYNLEKEDLLTRITILMGGRAAEELALNLRTAGAGNDFHRAASIARRMVSVWGMDDAIGPISVDGEYGAQPGVDNGWSETWKKQVDDRVADILRSRYEGAMHILTTHRDILEEVSQALLEHETLDAEQFEAIVNKLRPTAAAEKGTPMTPEPSPLPPSPE